MPSKLVEMNQTHRVNAVQALFMRAISLSDFYTNLFEKPVQNNKEDQPMENSLKMSIIDGVKTLEVQRQYEDESFDPPQITEKLRATLPNGFFEVTVWNGHILHQAKNLNRWTNNNQAYQRGMLLISASDLT